MAIISDIWREKIIARDLQTKGYAISPCHHHRKPYYDFMAHLPNNSTAPSLFVDAHDRNFSPRDLEKFKEFAEHIEGRAVKAHIKQFLGIFGLKVEYTIL
jgi:hypothetical protein